MGLRAWWKRFRSARTGEFVNSAEADENRDTTYSERVPVMQQEPAAPVPAEACTEIPIPVTAPAKVRTRRKPASKGKR